MISPRMCASIVLTRVAETPRWSLAARLEISPAARRSMTGIRSWGAGSALRVMRCPSRPKYRLVMSRTQV
ncbi:MAG: hypothetical protein WA944_02040 [Mycobacterium sp.]